MQQHIWRMPVCTPVCTLAGTGYVSTYVRISIYRTPCAHTCTPYAIRRTPHAHVHAVTLITSCAIRVRGVAGAVCHRPQAMHRTPALLALRAYASEHDAARAERVHVQPYACLFLRI